MFVYNENLKEFSLKNITVLCPPPPMTPSPFVVLDFNILDSVLYLEAFMQRLIDWLYTVLRPPQEFFLLIWRHYQYRWRAGDITNTGEGLQNLGLCTALRAFEQGGIFIKPHLLRHGGSVFPVSSEGPPHSVASYDTQGDAEDLF
jgi:hypothetical protein